MQTTKPRESTTFDRSYPGLVDQVAKVRADLTQAALGCPVADDLVLLTAELATNAILHSKSGHPGQMFTVRVTIYQDEYVWAEVEDKGGPWTVDAHDDEHGRGLSIVAAVAGAGNWGIDGDEGSRVAWFRLEWDQA
jgi:serine/threonine-protein kinase RsbW